MRKIISIIFILTFSMSLFSQGTDTLKDLEIRIEKLEQFQENLDKKYENKDTELDNEFIRVEQELKNDFNYMKIFGLFFGSVTIISLVVGFISISRHAIKYANKNIEKRLDNKFEEKTKTLLEVIKNMSEENQLKTTKKIKVLSDNNSDTIFIKKFFNEMGFENVDFKKTNKFEKLRSYDLLFFNNEDGKMKQEIVEEYVNTSKSNSLFFYFGSIRIKDFGANTPVVATNFRTQLYGNLINMLKYQKVLTN